MKTLTVKEEEIMGYFWEKGPLFVKELLSFYDEPKPHFNTLSTIVRGLEDKGFLAHHTFGNTYQYYPVVSEEDFRKGTLRNVISKYFNNSFFLYIVLFIVILHISPYALTNSFVISYNNCIGLIVMYV